ncbi:type II and III secretion system protein family protein [Arhodomonas sp. AD133]|uniref:type II and III secretion system protein family protein n=1 Tax=Arhodomonas sp. AD133 TaxID=3415009 RepID=UPI003EB85198
MISIQSLGVSRYKSAWLVILVFALLGVAGSATAGNALKHLTLHVGAVETVSVGSAKKVAVGNDEVLSVRVLDSGEMLLIPKAPGETDLVVWKAGMRKQAYRVAIRPGNMHRRLSSIRSVLSGFDGLTVRTVQGMVVVEGELDPALMELYSQVVEELPKTISLVRPASAHMRDLIRIKARVVEVDEQYRKEIGIRWDDSAPGPTVAVAGSFVSNDVYRIQPGDDGNVDWDGIIDSDELFDTGFHPFVGMTSALTSRLQLIAEDGAARLLAEPELTARSGETAEFLSGGEIPYQAIGADGEISVAFQEYGIKLQINPISDDNGNIVSHVMAEVSSVDYRTAIDGVPGLLTRRTESTINVKSGETIVISGLLTSEDAKDVDKVPLLGDLPLVGGLFRSTNRAENRKELVILVTPEIVTPEPDVPENLQKAEKELRTVLGDVDLNARLRE